jgi:hypothetical protein
MNLSPSDKKSLAMIMLFYAVLSYVVAPGVGLHLMKNKKGITYGLVGGSLLSIVLWLKVGQNKIQLS